MENYIEVWKKVLSRIESNISPITFNLWFNKLEPIAFQDGKIILLAPLKSVKNTVDTEYKHHIIEALTYVNDSINNYEIITEESIKFVEKKQHIEIPIGEIKTSSIFNDQYTFDNFVTGKSNNIARTAAKAVAENPGSIHNPLFIYGNVGLGKTHLMHAIGNQLRVEKPDKKVLYVTTETFVNEFIDMIRNNKMSEISKTFREKYRSVDVLMLDDVQFLKGKDATQEELFHTFNDLYNSGKQIVLTSDRHPRELSFLEERLKSRFSMGLTLDIGMPDYETRIAILQKKAFNKRFNIAKELIYFIADNFTSNIRELEGALTKVMFYCQLLNIQADDVSIVKEALKDDINSQESQILTIDTIVDKVCFYYGVDKTELIGKKKNKKIADSRQMCVFLIYDMLSIPFATIGDYFGGRDHATIIYSKNKIERLSKTDKTISSQIKDIKNLIKKQ